MSGAFTVVARGWSTTLQDHGRPGLAHLGVPRAGPVDRPLADLVSRVVGNPSGTVVVETAGGFGLRAEWPLVVASSHTGAPVSLQPGEVMHVPPGHRNLEYVAIRGGILEQPVLGSCSHDTLSGLGPRPVDVGARYEIGDDPGTPVHVDVAPIDDGPDRIRLWPGPRIDHLLDASLDALVSHPWEVTDRWSRVGVRLRGVPPPRLLDVDLPSEGLVLGAVQLPPSGEPVVMLADHPTTGGYPVVAVVHAEDLSALVRRRPGATIRFVAAARAGTGRSGA